MPVHERGARPIGSLLWGRGFAQPMSSRTFVPDLLDGKTALVTGGGSGLGRAMAEALRDHGANVAIASRSQYAEAAKEMGVQGYELDVRDPENCKAVVEQVEADLDGLDLLVNNAAGNFLVKAENLTPNGWRAVLGIVLDGTWNMSQAAFPGMKERGGGSMVNILATYAWVAASFVVHSGAAKAGVMNLTRTLATEWGEHQIRVNAIAPGPVVTKGASENLGYADEEGQAMLKRFIPMRRLGRPQDVSNALLFLASPAASWVTGDVLVVDGGQWLIGNPFAMAGEEL